ncbi:MAG: HesB/IscA family protein [Acidiferrobacteraceae bacterium]
MMTITPDAAKQIRQAAEQGGTGEMPLRVAAMRAADGTVEYMLGFDEPSDEDLDIVVEGIRVLISEFSRDLLRGITLDFVELTPGEFQFIFIPRPNDTQVAPERTRPDSG